MERQSLSGMVVKYEPTFNSNGLKKETLFFFPIEIIREEMIRNCTDYHIHNTLN